MKYFTKIAKKKDRRMRKADVVDSTTIAGTGAGVGATGYGAHKMVESTQQKGRIKAGPSVFIYGGAREGASGGFEAQSRAWMEALKRKGIQVQ